MERRTENHRLAQSFTRPALLASTLLLSSMLVTSAGGCKAIRERRTQRAAEREASRPDASANGLPNGNDRVSGETQEAWLKRQPIAQGQPAVDRMPESNPVEPITQVETPVVSEAQSPTQSPAQAQAETQVEPVSVPESEPETQMVIVDDRPSAEDNAKPGQSDEPMVEIVESRDGGVFNRQSKDQASYVRAVELHASGNLSDALLELERAIAINPQFTRAYLEAGDIYLELGQYEVAERQFARAVRAEPRNFMAQYRYGQVLHRLGSLEESNRAFLRALSIRPADYDANLGISTVLLELGRAEQALPYGQRAVRSEPPSGRARMHLGNVYAALDRHEEAVIEYQQAAELMDAPTAGLLLNMSESLNQLKRYAEMVGALDQLVRIEPNAIAYERLGSGLFRLRRYEESLAAFDKSSDLDPTHYPAYNGTAVCELNQYLWSSKTDGDARKRAVAAMRKSLRIERKQPRIVELLRRYSNPSSTEK